ncbi:hypothetical protein BDF20DRAFT_837430 [Mycotypha africana]|uniref:uncharacterized protein n=1 Tax=Mycotypha africana TaxID=64632 RepID=UPI00230171BD|nr:uncharacterized protein BDF20DRAFT_837430 [Mycotypha africana]KAI8973488.1 hypothetical protein BDF20DRAFT_837430 [Mycotypha africana]
MARIKTKNIVSILLLLVVLLSTLVPKVKAWTEADFEIFDLVDALEKAEGKDTNFYSYIGVSPSATQADISKAYRKLSLKWHPDKNKNDSKAKERFARLGVIVSILRDPRSRERYNFFLKNGVPRWRGTGYLYSRYRPGLGSALIVLLLIAGGMQYIAGQVNYRQEKKRILQWVGDARAQMVYNNVSGSKGSTAPTLGRSYIQLGDRQMRCEVKNDHYLVVYPSEDKKSASEPIHLNTEWVYRPTIKDIFLFAWPKKLFYELLNKQEVIEEMMEENDGMEEVAQDLAKEQQSESGNNKKSLRKRGSGEKVNVQGAKVGGRRRAVRK